MKSKGLAVVLAVSAALPVAPATGQAATDKYRKALPGYVYEFPRDFFDHRDFRTEWWYYTGNVQTAEGRRFGYELTFFRHAVDRSERADQNVWDISDVWLAHFALSDMGGKRFFHTERLNRSGPGLAGASAEARLVWNGNWSVRWLNTTSAGVPDQQLRAVAETFAITLDLRPEKGPVIHGRDGVSQKSAGAGRASHYVSLTRLQTSGTVRVEGKEYPVAGWSWMDHEFFTHSLEANQSGWDWFSLQFGDGTELMLYRLRRKDGTVEPYSSGTYVAADGRTRHLTLEEFELEPTGALWQSPETTARYPLEWRIRVPSLSIDIRTRTPLAQQELVSRSGTTNAYWEGAIDIEGTRAGQTLRGRGYVEMTGYAGAVNMGE
jgi:predicted secreted hydrolase